MKTQEVKRKNLIVGNEYYDQYDGGWKMIYLGKFKSEDGDKCRFFYPIDKTNYDLDSDGTIPFLVKGSPFYEQVND